MDALGGRDSLLFALGEAGFDLPPTEIGLASLADRREDLVNEVVV
jgi:hypothetical protein